MPIRTERASKFSAPPEQSKKLAEPGRTPQKELPTPPPSHMAATALERYRIWSKEFSAEKARHLLFSWLSADLTKIFQEASGQPFTQVAIPITWKNNQPEVWSPQFASKESVVANYQAGLETIMAEATALAPTLSQLDWDDLYQRYQAEITQVLTIFNHCLEPLSNHTISATPTVESLIKAGFTYGHIELQTELQRQLALPTSTHKTQTVWLGPPVITISPPSIWHAEGKTSFCWASRLAYLPELGQWIISQDGLFSGYNQQELFWGTQSFESLVASNLEANLAGTEFWFLNQLFSLPKSQTNEFLTNREILKNFAQTIGFFRPVPPREGTSISQKITPQKAPPSFLDLAEAPPSADTIATLITDVIIWETKNGRTQTPRYQANRLQHIDTIAAQMAAKLLLQETLDSSRFFEEYVKVAQKTQARSGFDLAETLNQAIAQAYPGISRAVNLMGLDCWSVQALKQSAQASSQVFSNPELLQYFANSKVISSESELKQICKALKKDPNRFKTFGTCQLCHKQTFVGECSICPICEYKDDLEQLKMASPESDKIPTKNFFNQPQNFNNYFKTPEVVMSLSGVLRGDDTAYCKDCV